MQLKKKVLAFASSVVLAQSVSTQIFADTREITTNVVSIANEGVSKNNDIVEILDPNLKKALNEVLGQQPNDDIRVNQISTLKTLDLSGKDISDIEGLHLCTELEELNLSNNNLEDLQILAPLTKLKKLDLSHNQVMDISYLEGMLELEELNLSNNNISDLAPIYDLKKMKSLKLQNNQVMDARIMDNENYTNTMIDLRNQKIPMREFESTGSFIETPNVVNVNLTVKLEPHSITNEGKYDATKNVLTWDNITKDIVNTYKFDYKTTNGEFTAFVTQPIKYVPANDGDNNPKPNPSPNPNPNPNPNPSPTPGDSLTDIDSHWAFKNIVDFANKGFIGGYEDGSFKPNNTITRAEFIKIVNKVFGFSETGNENFTDVESSNWFYNDVLVAVKAGYINGYEDNTFRPNESITRQEVAVVLNNILKIKETNLDKVNKYTDSSKIAPWALESLEVMVESGYLGGYEDNTLRPTDVITRAEAVTVLGRVETANK